ncbi:hypothetical protein Droror1_Dr00009640 [Drosera rotundifolia]
MPANSICLLPVHRRAFRKLQTGSNFDDQLHGSTIEQKMGITKGVMVILSIVKSLQNNPNISFPDNDQVTTEMPKVPGNLLFQHPKFSNSSDLLSDEYMEAIDISPSLARIYTRQ